MRGGSAMKAMHVPLLACGNVLILYCVEQNDWPNRWRQGKGCFYFFKRTLSHIYHCYPSVGWEEEERERGTLRRLVFFSISFHLLILPLEWTR